jgi:putative lipoic acid-binding regulatory protein
VLGDEAGVVLDVAERPSRDGTYLSLTFTLKVDNREQLERIYRRLHATGLVLYAL